MDEDSVYVCHNVRHHFKLIRSGSKTPGPPFRLLSKCVRCTATLLEIIGERITESGDRIPTSSHFIITCGRQIQVPSKIEKVSLPTAESERHDPAQA